MNLKKENEMDAGKWEGNNPWLGLSTYQEGTRLYGRDKEVSTLMDIVCNNLAMVVFGRSGIGKSSLIHAGISPEIRREGMMPIYIRLEHNTDISYVRQIEKAVCKELKNEDRLGDNVPQMGLWDFFHRNDFFNIEHQQTIPVIIIDQFEEIYTLADADHKHLAQELFEELADLLNNIKPAKVMSYEDEATRFKKSEVDMGGNDVLTFRVHSRERLNYTEDSNFHLVICLREDYLYYLERNTSKIPSFKVNRFSLQALDRDSAEDVIMLPRPGLFRAAEADDIISKISTFNDEGREEIDPTILSIFLFKYYNSKGNVKTENIIGEFYADETKGISRPSLAYLEDNLITGEGFRHFVPYNDALLHGVKKQELDLLIESRILTVETRKKHKYIEFSHDVICPIAKEHRERRKIDEQARKLRRRVLAATGLVIFSVLLIGTLLFLNHEVVKRERSLKIAQTVNASSMAHYMIVQGDVLNAIKLLLNVVPEADENGDYAVLPETERVLNEANDSLYSDYACIAILTHQDDVTTAEYSEDTKLIVTASNDGVCRVWDARSGEKLHELESNSRNMTGASMNSNGNKIITSFKNDTILIWDVASEQIIHTLTGHNKAVNYACFSPDGQYVLSASDDKTVMLWEAKTGKCLKTIVEHGDIVNCAVFSSDGKKIITSSEDGTAIVYDLSSETSNVIFNEVDGSVEYAEFNYDDTKIAVVTNKAVYVLNALTGKTECTLKGHTDMITSASFSPDGNTIATSSHDKTVKLWNVSSGKDIHTYKGHSNIVKDVVFSPDGKYLLSTSTDDEARIWNVRSSETQTVLNGDVGILNSITYSPDGKYVAAISVGGKAKVWDVQTKNVVSAFSVPEMANSVSFNRKSDKVAVAVDGHKIRVFDAKSGVMTDSLEVPDVESYDYAMFTDNDKSIIGYSHENRTIQYDLDTRKYRYIIAPREDHLTCLTFGTEKSRCLISSFDKHYFSEFILDEGRNLRTFDGHSKEVCSINYSHDNKSIISGASDNVAIIWDAETGNVIHKLKSHSSQVYYTEFSNDDSYALTASMDGTIRLWNVKTGKEIAIRNTPTSPRYTNAFCPNSSQYIIADGKDIRFYQLLNPKGLISNFKSRYKIVELTPEEKENYSIK